MMDEAGDRQSELKGTERDRRLGLKPESFGWVDVSWEQRQDVQGGEDVDGMEPYAWCTQSTTLPINVSAQPLNSLRDFQTTVWLPIKFVCHHEDIGLCIYS